MRKEHIDKIQNSQIVFPRVTLWNRNDKSRLYVDGCGYITEDGNDVHGRNSSYYRGFYYYANRPGKVGTLREIIDVIKGE